MRRLGRCGTFFLSVVAYHSLIHSAYVRQGGTEEHLQGDLSAVCVAGVHPRGRPEASPSGVEGGGGGAVLRSMVAPARGTWLAFGRNGPAGGRVVCVVPAS